MKINLHANFTHEHKCKNASLTTNKPNSTMNKKGNIIYVVRFISWIQVYLKLVNQFIIYHVKFEGNKNYVNKCKQKINYFACT